MRRLAATISDLARRIPGRAYLLIASIIFAIANPVTRKITELGTQHLIHGRNPISFCNVLFVGNLCALLLLLLIYHQQQNFRQLRRFSQADWLSLTVVGVLAGAIAPALIFLALSTTMVNNVVLIGRIEPPLTLALSILLLKERGNFLLVAGSVVSFIGVILTIFLQEPKGDMVSMAGYISVGQGELMAAAGAIFLAVATVISKAKLQQIPLGIFTITRTIIGTIVFFFVALQLFGPHHFTDAFSPLLWQWMLVYSAIIVVGGQLSWFRGLKLTTASEASLVSSFIPVVSILASYLILREQPNLAQYIGGGIILGGIALGQIGFRQRAEVATPQSNSVKEMDMGVGFKGV